MCDQLRFLKKSRQKNTRPLPMPLQFDSIQVNSGSSEKSSWFGRGTIVSNLLIQIWNNVEDSTSTCLKITFVITHFFDQPAFAVHSVNFIFISKSSHKKRDVEGARRSRMLVDLSLSSVEISLYWNATSAVWS